MRSLNSEKLLQYDVHENRFTRGQNEVNKKYREVKSQNFNIIFTYSVSVSVVSQCHIPKNAKLIQNYLS